MPLGHADGKAQIRSINPKFFYATRMSANAERMAIAQPPSPSFKGWQIA